MLALPESSVSTQALSFFGDGYTLLAEAGPPAPKKQDEP
jgi:hypothetical protein